MNISYETSDGFHRKITINVWSYDSNFESNHNLETGSDQKGNKLSWYLLMCNIHIDIPHRVRVWWENCKILFPEAYVIECLTITD